MIRRRIALIAVTLIALVAFPVVTPVWAESRPVQPTVHRFVLAGVDRPALASSPVAIDPAAALASDAATAPGAGAAAAPSATVPASRTPVIFTRAIETGRFSAAGVSWASASAPSGVVVQVRVREHGAWSPWQPLAVAAGPDPTSSEGRAASARVSTEPISSGSADAIQVRLDSDRSATPDQVTLLAVDAGTSPADAHPAGTPANTAQGAVARPTIISRAQWGADENLLNLHGPCPGYSPTVRVGFVHHTVGSNTYSAAESAGIVRGIYAYHVIGNGWCDVGYNFLVDRYGQIFEGRHGGIDRPVIGAHTLAFNYDSFSVSGMGTFSTAAAPAAMVSSMAAVLGWKLSLSARDPRATAVLTSGGGLGAKWPAGTPVVFNVVSGHRDAYATECPGSVLYNRLPSMRTAASDYIATHDLGSTLVPSVLGAGAVVRSPNGRFLLTMQADGNLVTYSGSRVVWSSGTFFPHSSLHVQGDGNVVIYGTSEGLPLWSPLVYSAGGRLEIQNDGNLVLYTPSNTPLWDSYGTLGRAAVRWNPTRVVTALASGTGATTYNEAYRLSMQGDGNLVLTTGAGRPVWWSGTARAGSRFVVQSDGNAVIYDRSTAPVWSTATRTPGSTLLVQNDGNIVLYDPSNRAVWHSR